MDAENPENNASENEPPKPGHEGYDPHDLRRLLKFCWREARRDYRAAGAPLGPSQRGFELWIRFETRTTPN